MADPHFTWGSSDSSDFIADVERAYELTTTWRKNVFKLPSGLSGKLFTKAMARLYEGYALRSPLESIALKAAAVITPLLLQQPAGKPTYRVMSAHLLRRLKLSRGSWRSRNRPQLRCCKHSGSCSLPLRMLQALPNRCGQTAFRGCCRRD